MNFNKKKILISVSTALASSVIVSVPLVIDSKNIQNNFIMNKNLNSNKNLKADTNKNLFDYVENSINNNTLNNQYYSESNSGDSFAILTTSNVSGTSADSVSKYDLIGNEQGKQRWSVDLSTLSGKTSNKSITSIKAIKYSSGSLESKGWLFVLASDTTNTYLFKINWDNGNSELVSTITSSSPTFISILNEEKNDLMLFEFPKISTSADNTIKTYSIKESTKSSKATINPTNADITIKSNIASSKFNNNMFVSSVSTKNGDIFVLYQNETLKNDTPLAYSIVKLTYDGTNKINNNVNANNIVNYRASEEEINKFSNTSDKYLANLIDKGDNKNYAIVSKSKKDGKSVFISNLDSNNMTLSTTLQEISENSTNVISQIKPMYSNTGKIDGYIGLVGSNAIKFTNDFTSSTKLVDFPTNTSVYNIMTVRGKTDWYPQDKDGTIGDYNNSTLIGQLDTLATTETTEIIVDYSFKTIDELPLDIRYKKAINDNGVDSQFTSFLNSNNSYNSFLNIKSSDNRFPNPIINITAEKDSSSNSLNLTFKQTLRTRQTNGNIVNSDKIVNLGTYKYSFINENATINAVQSVNEIPSFMINSLPSNILEKDIKKYLFNYTNLIDFDIRTNPDDQNGILNVSLIIPYMWEEDILKTNVIKDYSFGTIANPFFKKDLLAGYDSSVTLVSSEFLEKNENSSRKESLELKYNSKLPSEIKAKEYLDDFVILGSAFRTQSLLNSDKISPPTEENITITPLDQEGVAIVDLIVPKIGDRENVKFSFKTANVFKTNIYANENFYFMFKDNDEVLNIDFDSSKKYKDYAPSKIQTLLSTAQAPDKLRSSLANFANFSNYFGNLINKKTDDNKSYMDIIVTPDDVAGSLEITIQLLENLPGTSTNRISQTFTGFNKSGSIVASISGFNFKQTLSQSLFQKSPSLITQSELETDGVFNYTGSASSLEKEITLSPSNNYGSLQVSILFKNWVTEEKDLSSTGGTVKKIIPEKRFTINYSGFEKSDNSLNMVVWKSFEELDNSYKIGLLPSEVIRQVEASASDNFKKLEIFANVSETFKLYLSDPKNKDKISLNLSFNDTEGTISIVGQITIDNQQNPISTTIGGFKTTAGSYAIIMARDDSEILNSLREKLPSEISDEEIGKLYSLSSGNKFTKEIITSFNNIEGTLTVTVQLYDEDNVLLSEATQTYSKFKKDIPIYKGTNWLIFSLSIIIPSIILLVPILFIKFYVDRRNIISKSKLLDKRLYEESKVKKVKNIRTIRDLA